MNTTYQRVPCIGCGALVPDVDGPVHAYLDASPGCWDIYGQILAKEFGEYQYPAVHQLAVDAYAVQHPGVPARSARDRRAITSRAISSRAIQSVAVHLIRLYLVLERGLSADIATEGMRRALRHRERFCWIEPPASLGEVTVVDVLRAKDLAEHEALVRRWACSAWEAWTAHHATVRHWAEGRDE